MKKVLNFIASHSLWFLMVLGGVGLWFGGLTALGDNAGIIGPEWIVKKNLGFLSIGLALVGTLAVVYGFFRCTWDFCDPADFKGKRVSEYEKAWAAASPETKLKIATTVWLVVFYCLSQVFSL